MSFNFHIDKKTYSQQQYLVTKDYIIPFISSYFKNFRNLKILEIGCAQAGVLRAFIEGGCANCVGVELNKNLVKEATTFMKKEVAEKKLILINKDIYNIGTNSDLWNSFDLIIVKDVIEHIKDQQKFIFQIKKMLNSNGKIFFAFPPWQMPFGGHQQICRNKVLSRIPFIHLLPRFIYKLILIIFREPKEIIKELLEIKTLGISIERFEKTIKEGNLNILAKEHYLINPIYKYKFNLKPKKQFLILKKMPFLRNYFTTSVYYLVGKDDL